MPTEDFYINNNSIELDGFIPLCDSNLAMVQHYVEITGHLIEIHEIFLLFMYNLKSIHNTYLIQNDSNIIKNGRPADTQEDYIAVNALVINLISSARTLVESMETFARNQKDTEHVF